MSDMLQMLMSDILQSENKSAINNVGEILRSWIFPGKGYGCYTNFDVNNTFSEIQPRKRELEVFFLYTLDELSEKEIEENLKMIKWYKNKNNIEVGWLWDGDGSLAIYVPKVGLFINDDCKKDNRWLFKNDEYLKSRSILV